MTIPNSVTSIGAGAFTGTSIKEEIIWNEILIYIPSFYEGSYYIPNSVKSIGEHVFNNCPGLTSVTIPNSVTSIGENVFNNCPGLTQVTIPNSVTTIGSGAFSDCSGLTQVTIPNSVTSIGYYAFAGCSGLTQVTIPNSVTSIGDHAFYDCSGLTQVTIPNSVTSIGYRAFYNCDNLTSVTSLALTPPYNGDSFSTYGTLHVLYGCGDAYAAANCWMYFTIVEDAESTDTGDNNPVLVNTITFAKDMYMIKPNDMLSLTPTIAPENASSKTLEWVSSNEKIATVTNGVVNGISGGMVTITAKAMDKSNVSASCKVIVDSPITGGTTETIPVCSLTLDTHSKTLKVSDKFNLTVNILPTIASNKEVAWRSSDINVAMVDSKGVVTAIGTGKATIIVTSKADNKIFDECTVTVEATASEEDLPVYYPYIMVTDFTIQSKDVTTRMITARASQICNFDNSSFIGKVSLAVSDAKGNFVKAFGTPTEITSSMGYYSYLTNPRTIEGVIPELQDGAYRLCLAANRSGYRGWSIVKRFVLMGGYIRDKDIDCYTEFWVTNGELSFESPSFTLSLDKKSLILKVGDSADLKVSINPSYAADNDVSWSSSDAKVVTVSQNGSITAVGMGQATVRATSKYDSNVYDECVVTVGFVPVESIQLSKNDVKLEEGESVTLTATVSPTTATVKDVTWTSSNEDVAMVSKSGKVLAVKAGTATITAMATDGSGVKATATVTVTPVTVKSIALNHTSYSLEKGENVTLEVTISPANAANKKVTWSSSNEDVVMVSSTGRCICLGEGTATVTATTTDGSNLSATCVFNCTDGIMTITMDGDSDIKVYDIEGRKLGNLKKGVNIIRMDDGTTRKVVKK